MAGSDIFLEVNTMKTLKTLLIFFLFVIVLSGCGVRQVNESLPNTADVHEKQATPKEDFIPGFHPFKDDPDNPSPHNPLVRKYGDIPEVRTYIRLKQKLAYGHGLNIDEAIELYTAEYHLYPSDTTKANLKKWKKDRERYIRLAVDMGGPVLTDSRNPIVDPSAEEQADTKSAD